MNKLFLALLLAAVPAMAADPNINNNSCGSPANTWSASPETTTFSLTTTAGDSAALVGVGYRSTAGKHVASVTGSTNGAFTLKACYPDNVSCDPGNTLGAEIWAKDSPTAGTETITVAFTNTAVFVWGSTCGITLTNVSTTPEDTDSVTSTDVTAGISLSGLSSTTDKALFIDVAVANCGCLVMTAESGRTNLLDDNASGSVEISIIVGKTPAGSDTVPYSSGSNAVPGTEVGIVYGSGAAAAANKRLMLLKVGQ